MKHFKCSYLTVQGFSMLEVLVTMAVVSFGLLGVAALQIKSLQHAHATYQRSIATTQANDLVERLWASVCALPTGRNEVTEQWVTFWENDNRLPGWSGELDYDSSVEPPRYTVTISWTNNRVDTSDDGSGAAQSFAYRTAIPELTGCP